MYITYSVLSVLFVPTLNNLIISEYFQSLSLLVFRRLCGDSDGQGWCCWEVQLVPECPCDPFSTSTSINTAYNNILHILRIVKNGNFGIEEEFTYTLKCI